MVILVVVLVILVMEDRWRSLAADLCARGVNEDMIRLMID